MCAARFVDGKIVCPSDIVKRSAGASCGICDLNACLRLMRPTEYRTLPIPFVPAAILQYPQALTSLARVVRCCIFLVATRRRGVAGFEPASPQELTYSPKRLEVQRLRCSNQLSYTPCRFCRGPATRGSEFSQLAHSSSRQSRLITGDLVPALNPCGA